MEINIHVEKSKHVKKAVRLVEPTSAVKVRDGADQRHKDTVERVS